MDACIDGELFHLCEEDIQNGMLGWGTNGSPKNKKKGGCVKMLAQLFFMRKAQTFPSPGFVIT